MKDKKYPDDDPERTLVTLDQLSQTIEVMTSVVNRLRRHLSDQIKSQLETQEGSTVEASPSPESKVELEQREAKDETAAKSDTGKRESFVVEISQQEIEPIRKSNKILH